MSGPERFAVIGGGILGTAVARELTTRFPSATITLFEKEPSVGRHQTGHNSGVLHAGLYYEPGSLKAALCRRGVGLMTEYATEKRIPYEQCGKVVVALEAEERPRLRSICERARANGVPGVAMVGPNGLRSLEPHVTGIEALHSPRTGIIDYRRVAECLSDDIRSAGGAVHLGIEILDIASEHAGVRLVTNAGDFVFDHTVVCGGLQSDRLAVMAGSRRTPAIVPFFGQYLLLGPEFRTITNGLVYPVPDPRYPFLGVHLTKRVDGAMTIGPNAFLALDRERYSGFGIRPRDLRDILREPGFWRFAGHNLPSAFREARGVLSRRRLVSEAARYVPEVADAVTVALPRGVRAQAVTREGRLVDDFVIEHRGALTLLRNAPSPGATASLAIAEYLVRRILDEQYGIRGASTN